MKVRNLSLMLALIAGLSLSTPVLAAEPSNPDEVIASKQGTPAYEMLDVVQGIDRQVAKFEKKNRFPEIVNAAKPLIAAFKNEDGSWKVESDSKHEVSEAYKNPDNVKKYTELLNKLEDVVKQTSDDSNSFSLFKAKVKHALEWNKKASSETSSTNQPGSASDESSGSGSTGDSHNAGDGGSSSNPSATNSGPSADPSSWSEEDRKTYQDNSKTALSALDQSINSLSDGGLRNTLIALREQIKQVAKEDDLYDVSGKKLINAILKLKDEKKATELKAFSEALTKAIAAAKDADVNISIQRTLETFSDKIGDLDAITKSAEKAVGSTDASSSDTSGTNPEGTNPDNTSTEGGSSSDEPPPSFSEDELPEGMTEKQAQDAYKASETGLNRLSALSFYKSKMKTEALKEATSQLQSALDQYTSDVYSAEDLFKAILKLKKENNTEGLKALSAAFEAVQKAAAKEPAGEVDGPEIAKVVEAANKALKPTFTSSTSETSQPDPSKPDPSTDTDHENHEGNAPTFTAEELPEGMNQQQAQEEFKASEEGLKKLSALPAFKDLLESQELKDAVSELDNAFKDSGIDSTSEPIDIFKAILKLKKENKTAELKALKDAFKAVEKALPSENSTYVNGKEYEPLVKAANEALAPTLGSDSSSSDDPSTTNPDHGDSSATQDDPYKDLLPPDWKAEQAKQLEEPAGTGLTYLNSLASSVSNEELKQALNTLAQKIKTNTGIQTLDSDNKVAFLQAVLKLAKNKDTAKLQEILDAIKAVKAAADKASEDKQLTGSMLGDVEKLGTDIIEPIMKANGETPSADTPSTEPEDKDKDKDKEKEKEPTPAPQGPEISPDAIALAHGTYAMAVMSMNDNLPSQTGVFGSLVAHRTKTNYSDANATVESSDLTIGASTSLNSTTSVGGMLTGRMGGVTLPKAGKLKTRGFGLKGFAQMKLPSGLFGNATLGVDRYSIKMGNVRVNTTALSAGLEGGMEFAFGDYFLAPSAKLKATRFGGFHYTMDDVNYHQSSGTSLLGRVGTKFGVHATQGTVFAAFDYYQELAGSQNLTATQNNAQTKMTVKNKGGWMAASVGANLGLSNAVTLELKAQYDFAGKRKNGINAGAKVIYKF